MLLFRACDGCLLDERSDAASRHGYAAGRFVPANWHHERKIRCEGVPQCMPFERESANSNILRIPTSSSSGVS